MISRGLQRGTMNVDGVRITCAIQGSGLPTLVVGSAIYYPRTFSADLSQKLRLAFVDLPHFVPLPNGFDLGSIGFDLYTRCIDTARERAALERVLVVGHSHHGNVALEYARRFPQRVLGVVMICSPPVGVAETIEGARRYWDAYASIARKRLLEVRRRTASASQNEGLSPSDAYITNYVTDAPLYWHDPTYDAAWLWEGMQFEIEGVHAFRDLFRDYRAPLWREALDVPVLVVMGRDDYAVPHTLWNDMPCGEVRVSIHVIDRSGHTPQLEQTEAFDMILMDWLNRHVDPASPPSK